MSGKYKRAAYDLFVFTVDSTRTDASRRLWLVGACAVFSSLIFG